MEYSPIRIKKVLLDGEYDNYHYVIVSYGTHPCAYVEIPKWHPYYEKDYDECDINVHGGLTFGSDLDHVDKKYTGYYLGWDYAHLGDFHGMYLDERLKEYMPEDDKKWTVEEIFEDVKDVIKQLGEK